MKLKCIGGPMNGHFNDDYRELRHGDQVRVREPRKYDITAPVFLDPHKMSEMMTDMVHYYKVVQFSLGDEIKYKFLIPVDWTEKQALRFALTE